MVDGGGAENGRRDGIGVQRLWGRPIRRQNNQLFPLWLRPCGPSHLLLLFVVLSFEFDLNTSYLNYLVFFDLMLLVCFDFPLFFGGVVHECVCGKDALHNTTNNM